MSIPAFELNAEVQLVNASDAVGRIRSRHWNEQIETWMYTVIFGQSIQCFPETSLRVYLPPSDAWTELRERSVAGAKHFRHALAYHRVRQPPSRIAKSFSSARTQFYPYQFKPLLKFLDNPEKRILIGDDVGLGKTIEAGYILCELNAQRPLDSILIVAPAGLRAKWKTELQNRFGEQFEILNARDLQSKVQNFDPHARHRWILSYETVRMHHELLEAAPPHFDLVIIDEAHRVRNTASQQHRAIRSICSAAEAIVMLSATPIQNRREDLWVLLRLLSPEIYGALEIFDEQMNDNEHLIAASSALARAEYKLSLSSLNAFLNTRTGVVLKDTRAANIARTLLGKEALSLQERIEAQTLLTGLSPFSQIFTRTRKLEAIPDTPPRKAEWHSIELTPTERKIHSEIERLCAQGSRAWGDERGLVMLYRALASSIPAAMAKFTPDRMAQSIDRLILEAEEEETEDAGSKNNVGAGELAEAVSRAMAHYQRLGVVDSKFSALIDTLESVWSRDRVDNRPLRKVLIFSYFRGTVEYLYRKLLERKVECRAIHGGHDVEERNTRLDDFLKESSTVRVLITTDISGEGIDLEQASVVINYDLPWNPMVLEQRIGRIDRIGQKADELIIRNLVIRGSVEERILKRLFERIGIFTRSIGTLDPILGEAAPLKTLTERALLGQLSESVRRHVQEGTPAKSQEGAADYADQRLLEQIDAVQAQQAADAEHLESRIDELLAADRALLDEIEAVTKEHQLPSQEHLLQLLNDGLRIANFPHSIPHDALNQIVSVHLPNEVISNGQMNRTPITLSREAAYRMPQARFIHSAHPLTKWAVEKLGSPRKAFSLKLCSSTALQPGAYAFVLRLLLNQGTTVRGLRLVGGFAPLSGAGEPVVDQAIISRILGELLAHAEDIALKDAHFATLEEAIGRLNFKLEAEYARINAREKELHELREERRLANIFAGHELAVRRAREQLKAYRTAGKAGFVINMAEARYQKAVGRLKETREGAVRTTWDFFGTEDIAVGLLQVGDD